jgi:hypothetical protein
MVEDETRRDRGSGRIQDPVSIKAILPRIALGVNLSDIELMRFSRISDTLDLDPSLFVVVSLALHIIVVDSGFGWWGEGPT